VHTKFYEYPSGHYLAIECLQTDITCEEDRLGWVGSGWVSDAHAQRVMRNEVITPPHDFKQPPCLYYQEKEVKEYEFGVVTYGITSIPNFINFRPAILQLFNASRRASIVKTSDLVELGWVGLG
jgi:hypothetical protein